MATAEDAAEASTQQSVSDVVYDNICQPCKNDGKILEAEGRCEDCDEFLCKRCFLSHTIPSVTRNHVMIDKDQLKKGSTPDKKDQCTQRCPQHNDEILKYYCSEHKFLGCSACMILDHKSCTETLYIPKVAKDIANNDLYKRYKERKMAVETKSSEITTHTQAQIDTVTRYQAAAVEKMKTFKDECIAMLETTEKENIKESERIKTEELDKQRKSQDESVAVLNTVKDVTSQIESLESKKQYCNAFIAMIKAQDELKSCDDRLNEIDIRDEPLRKVFFTANKDLKERLAAGGIGKIVKEPLEVQQLKHERNIDVKTQSDAKTCWISGSATLPDNRVILADCENDKLKMIDFHLKKVVEELKLGSHPWAVAATHNGQVVVALSQKKKLAYVKTDSKLVKDREINVDGVCSGVAYSNDKLVVTFETPEKVELMDMDGHVLTNIATNASENKIMCEPLYAITNPFTKTIYVANANLSNVLCLKYDGTLVATYTDKELQWPLGMTVDGRGMVYVCNLGKHNVHQITKDGKKARILLTEQDVTQPYTISYSDIENKFYIGMKDCDVVKVFKVV